MIVFLGAMDNTELDVYRTKISKIDDMVIDLLIERFELTDKVGMFKRKNNIPIENKDVEKRIIARLVARGDNKVDGKLILKVYSEIFKHSKERQEKL